MVSGQNLKLIAPHLLARTHLCLDWCRRSQDPRSFNPRLGLAPIHMSVGLARQGGAGLYHLGSVGFSVNQLRFKEKC